MKIVRFFVGVVLLLPYTVYSQCPTVDFNIQTNGCINENILIDNSSFGVSDFEWDFCPNDFESSPIIGNTDVASASVPLGFKLVFDGENWYGFITNRGTSKIFRLDYGNNLDNSFPEVVDLGNPGGFLNQPEAIDIIKVGNFWYCLVTKNISNPGNDLILLELGENIENDTPSVVSLGNFGISSKIRGVKAVYDGGNIYIVLSTGSKNITIVNFGNSFYNTIGSGQIISTNNLTNANAILGIDVLKTCDNWYVFAASFDANRIHKLKFGNDLFTQPIEESSFTFSGIQNPFSVKAALIGSQSYVLVGNFNDPVILLRYDDISSTDTPNILSQATHNIPRLTALDIGFQRGRYFVEGIHYIDHMLTKIVYDSVCDASITYLKNENPGSIYFSSQGSFDIVLKGTDNPDNKAINFSKKTVSITNLSSPEIVFDRNDNQCLTVVNSFSSTNNTPSQTVLNWIWDFGDGSPTKTGQNVSHQYFNSGIYKVVLQAESANTCNQTTFEKIIIFDEPVPDFTLPVGLNCSNQGLLFTNTTPGDYGDIISWTWDFGDGENSTEENPVHAFSSAGTYNVKLTGAIPSCATETTISVDVVEGPAVTYSFANDCFNNSITFTNNTTGTDITGYTWNFGDGTTSNLVNPTHTYAAPGDYTVMLTADNALGCSVTNSQTVTVYALPEVAFINELSCSNGTTQFFDQTTAANANITNWAWDFGDGNTSTEKDPAHIYQISGSFLVSLTATTNFGCTATLEKMVDVIAGPTVDFAIDQVCLGEESQFEDLSETIDGSAITSRFWEIDGQVFTEQNPTATFALPGTYQASLTVTSSTFCTATITKDVVINPLPVADFGAENACVNDAVRFIDESIVTGDAIGIYQWNFSNLGNSSDANPVFTFEATGDYVVGLTITTEAGCVSTISKSISILERPEGAFNTDVSQGPPPLMVNFENSSMGADNFNWDFGNGEKSAVTNPIFTFTDLGLFEVIMIASTDAGCADTARQIINIVEPIMDVAIEGMTTLSQDGKTRVSLDIKNNGSLFVDKAEIALEIGSEASVTEILEQTIAPGELVVYPLNISITNRNTTPYLCATLVLPESAFAEANLTNNTYCINLNEKSNVIDPFPNPTDRLITVGVVLEESQKVNISMHNAMGQPVLEREIPEAPEGLNEFQVDVTGIGNGIYWLKLQYGSSEEVFRVFVSK